MASARRCLACKREQGFALFDLGSIPPVNGFSASSNRENAFPLELWVCLDCWLCQLEDAPDPELLFRDYKHFSGASSGNLEHLRGVAAAAESLMSGRSKVKVLEMGCNDGSLLEMLSERGYDCLGVDPAKNMRDLHESKGLRVIHDFFDERLAERIAPTEGPFDLVIGLNVLAHFPTFMSAFRGARALLAPDGLFHVEVADATETLANGRFDTIYHEHICNYTMTSIDAVLSLAGLRGVRAEKIDTQGGSLRVVAGRDDGSCQTEASYRELLSRDRDAGVGTRAFYLAVKEKTESTIASLNEAYADFCSGEDAVLLLGAPARGVVMCNSTVLKNTANLHAIDDTPAKHGCLVPGTDIPVGGWEAVAATGARKAILLSWNYRTSMLERLAAAGFAGQVLVPLPELEIVSL